MSGIAITAISKRFGATAALKNVSLDIASGEFLALVGPSGCGKTTLMRIVAGIETPDDGTIAIAGREVTGLRAADRDVAMVFQSYALYPHLTVRQNIAVPLMMRRLSALQRLPFISRVVPGFRRARMAIAEEVARVAEPLGLASLLDRRPAQLSGGQRQRVALARAIVRRPRAFLMDEPLSNLDASLRVQTRREIVDIHRSAGVATIYVTHDQEEALTMADRVAVMLDGEILQVATPEEIYADPTDLRVASFIGSPRINLLGCVADGAGLVHVAGQPTGVKTPARGPMTLALRPEALVPAAGGLAAIIQHVEFLGDGLLAHARHEADGAALIARLDPAARGGLVPGRRVALSFDPSRALLFDRDGRRLDSAVDRARVAA